MVMHGMSKNENLFASVFLITNEMYIVSTNISGTVGKFSPATQSILIPLLAVILFNTISFLWMEHNDSGTLVYFTSPLFLSSLVFPLYIQLLI